LVENALHYAFGSLAGAANKLENAPQGTEDTGNLLLTVSAEITAVERLLSSIDIERVKTDPVYAGSQLKRAQVARDSAESIDKLAAAIANVVTGISEVGRSSERRAAFLAAPKKKVAVVKGAFTHTRGGGPVRFFTGENCDIDHELQNGYWRIAGANGNTSVAFTQEEVERLFDIVEA
jgi:hypothetical protein